MEDGAIPIMKKLLLPLFLILFSNQVIAEDLTEENNLFDLIEQTYSQYFSPAGATTKNTFENTNHFFSRSYADTNTSLKILDDAVYASGDLFGGSLYVGQINDFLSTGFSQELLTNKTFYVVSENRVERFTISFNGNTATYTADDGSEEGPFIIDTNGVISFLSFDDAPLWKLISSSQSDYYLINEIRTSNGVWEDQTDDFNQVSGGVTIDSFNNDITALKDYFLEKGLWQTTINSDGLINKINSDSNTGVWWIEGDIFYFEYPDNESYTDTKAYKLADDKAYFATDAKYTHSARLYFDQAKADEYYQQLQNDRFTTEWFDGKTLYWVIYDDFGYEDVGKKWNMAKIDFESKQFNFTEIDTTDTATHTFTYTVNNDGVIVYNEGNTFKVQYGLHDKIRICGEDTNCNSSEDLDQEYFFYNYQTAKEFACEKNADCFTNKMISGKTFYSVNKNSNNGETCILEATYASSTVTQKEWVYHSDDNWIAGCQEDFGDINNLSYNILNGLIQWQNEEKWTFELNEISSDSFKVTDPDGSHNWYFSKEKINSLL